MPSLNIQFKENEVATDDDDDDQTSLAVRYNASISDCLALISQTCKNAICSGQFQ